MPFDPSPNPMGWKVTIGDLFPADDLVAQWVFTLNCVAQDLEVITWPLRDAESLRAKMYYFRSLITRIYEAGRLITAYNQSDEVRDFASPILGMASVDLVTVYTRPSTDGKSEVEKLFADSRHRTVHYPAVGSQELHDLLLDYHKFPARLSPELKAGAPAIDTQWVSVVRAGDSLGAEPWDPTIWETLTQYSSKVADISTAWVMSNVMSTIAYAALRGIDLERLIDDEEKLKEMAAMGKQLRQPDGGDLAGA